MKNILARLTNGAQNYFWLNVVVGILISGLSPAAGESQLPPGISLSQPNARTESINSWLIFGFTEGADVGKKYDRVVFHESLARISRREGGYAAWDSSWGLGYSTSNQAVWWIGGTISWERNAESLGGDNLASSRGFGPFAGFKYQILQRGMSPFGLAVQFAPFWQQIEIGPTAYQRLGGEIRLIADTTLVPDRVFAAVNAAYQPERSAYTDGSFVRESILEMSGALSNRVWEKVFLGSEFRYLKKYHNYYFNELAGQAVYLGPTLFVPVGEHGYFGAAWSFQIAGKATTVSGHLDLLNFERHQLRIKVGFTL